MILNNSIIQVSKDGKYIQLVSEDDFTNYEYYIFTEILNTLKYNGFKSNEVQRPFYEIEILEHIQDKFALLTDTSLEFSNIRTQWYSMQIEIPSKFITLSFNSIIFSYLKKYY